MDYLDFRKEGLIFFDFISFYVQQRDGRWRNAVFLFRVTDTSLLPIKNIANLPKTASMSRYHLEVGPVCFL